MENKKIVDLVIPSWFLKEGHDGKYSKYETFYIASECLNRLLKVTPRNLFNLILIDNGSDLTDDDVKGIENIRFKPSWYWDQADILIKNKVNLGFGGGMNQGLALTTSEYVMQINNDVLIWSGCIEEVLNTFNQKLEKPIGLAMPALEKSGIKFPEVLNLKKEDVDMKTNAGKWGIHAQFGSFWCIKKNLLEELYKKDGFYFDPQFKMLFKEDRDLYQRLYAMGYETYRNHFVRVHHVGNVSVRKVVGQKDFSRKNKELYEKKWKGKEK